MFYLSSGQKYPFIRDKNPIFIFWIEDKKLYTLTSKEIDFSFILITNNCTGLNSNKTKFKGLDKKLFFCFSHIKTDMR